MLAIKNKGRYINDREILIDKPLKDIPIGASIEIIVLFPEEKKSSKNEWLSKVEKMSVWDEETLNRIENVGREINKWKITTF
ncbi:MAG: hypothetical protein DRH57_00955 [Candidatus Cloacimonadota bacterium]|nr:MAG: hypothetical protein DRH57_00955 [Candidatus Cloacimonadota bacterium]